MYILIKNLYEELNTYSEVFIYGAGDYAKAVYQLLKNVGLRDKINAFIVTNLNEVRDIDGINVKPISEFASYHTEKGAVLIATSSMYERQIVQNLQTYNFAYVLKLTDYIMQDDVLTEMLGKGSDKQFVANVIEDYVWNHLGAISELENKKKAAEHSIAQRNESEISENTIVFISGYLTSRSEKIICALVKKKYNVIVLEYGCHNELVANEIVSSVNEFWACKDVIELMYMAIMYKPLVYYCEPDWGDCSAIELIIRHKDLFGKVVFSPYDVLNDGYVQISGRRKEIERYCFENADGVVWRWFSKEFLEEKKGFYIKGKSIQFIDYCKGFEITDCAQSDHKLKICFVQGMIYDLLDESLRINDGKYVEVARIDTILRRLGERDDCVFHIFIGEYNSSDKEKLDLLQNRFSNFKVFYGAKYSELITKIAKYDYGCFFYTGGKDIPELESIDNTYYGSIYINGMQSRYFDYLDAGIPIVATRSKKLCDQLERLGVLVKMDILNIDIDYLKKNKEHYKRNVVKAKVELLIDNHIQRLIDFFVDL